MKEIIIPLILCLCISCGTSHNPPNPTLTQVEQVLFPSGIKGELRYVRNGQPLVILLHGPGFDRKVWFLGTSDDYERSGRAVLLLDVYPGGSPDGVSLASVASDVHSIVEQLRGRFPVIVFHGVSLGAAIAVRTQADYMDANGLILQSLSPQSHFSGIRQADAAALASSPEIKIPSGIRSLFVDPTGSSVELQAQDAGPLNAPMPRGLALAWLKLHDDPSEVRISGVGDRVLVQYGSSDTNLAPKGDWNLGIGVKVYPQIGHIFDLHRRELRTQVISDMLSAADRFAPVR